MYNLVKILTFPERKDSDDLTFVVLMLFSCKLISSIPVHIYCLNVIIEVN